jgi:pimeloyl-ACP methyl ester carboxylesterase/DNA-binding CsgD family transcriptional regulator
MAGMEPQIEYATASDGRRIACFAIGSGKPFVTSATPPWSHVQQEMSIPTVGAWLREIALEARVIRYDCRGTGLSDRDGAEFTVDEQVRDMEAVVDHYGLESFALWGTIGGSPASIVYAARHPERVSHLLLWGAYVRGATLLDRVAGAEALGDVMRDNWQVFTDMFAQIAFGWPDADTAAGYAQLMRDGIAQEAAMRAWRQTAAMDVTEDARAVRVPALVMVRRGATISGVEDARELTGLIPSARLLILDGSSHAPFLENPDLVTAAIREFIASEHAVPAPRPALAPLTDREREVLRLLASGQTGKQIAAELAISLPTAQRHIANIYGKIGARGRVEAAAYAFEHGMLPRRS